MLKESTHKEKFAMLTTWLPFLIEAVKKDLKNEHLKNDWGFARTYFPGKNPSKLNTEELVEGYIKALNASETAEELAEFISNRWLIKHSELYYFFEKELKKINPNFNEIELIKDEVALPLIESAVHAFGAPETYLFCVLNSVAFSDKAMQDFGQRAEQSANKEQREAEEIQARLSIEEMQQSYEQQIARLTDKYEKKLQGLQKKYLVDVENLKKQIAALQRKLS